MSVEFLILIIGALLMALLLWPANPSDVYRELQRLRKLEIEVEHAREKLQAIEEKRSGRKL